MVARAAVADMEADRVVVMAEIDLYIIIYRS